MTSLFILFFSMTQRLPHNRHSSVPNKQNTCTTGFRDSGKGDRQAKIQETSMRHLHQHQFSFQRHKVIATTSPINKEIITRRFNQQHYLPSTRQSPPFLTSWTSASNRHHHWHSFQPAIDRSQEAIRDTSVDWYQQQQQFLFPIGYDRFIFSSPPIKQERRAW